MIFFESENVDTYIADLQTLDTQVTQVSKGQFYCNKNCILLPDIEINNWFVNTSMLYHGCLSEDKLYVSFPLGNAPLIVDGVSGDTRSPLVIPRKERVIVIYPESSQTLDFVIDPSLLSEFSRRELYEASDRHKNKHVFFEASAAKKKLGKKIVRDTLHTFQTIDSFNYRALLDYRDSLAVQLNDYISPRDIGLKDPVFNRRLAVVQRALEHIHSTLDSSLTIKRQSP
jgi:hypothetical protein